MNLSLATAFLPVRTKCPPRRVAPSRQQIIQAMRDGVARAGARHRARSHSTLTKDISGFTCIQGELMRQLGYSLHERSLAGSYMTVSTLLDPEQEIAGLTAALAAAQFANDDGQPWGEILARFEYALAA